MTRLAVRLHRRHGWLSVAVLIVGGKAKRRWAAGRAAA